MLLAVLSAVQLATPHHAAEYLIFIAFTLWQRLSPLVGARVEHELHDQAV
jgi:hypothetical protein